MRSARTEAFWNAFCRHEGLNHARHEVTSFKTLPDVAKRLTAMVLAGRMRATAGPIHCFSEEQGEPVPVAGEYAVLLDREGRPRLIWRTTGVEIAPFSSVTDEFLWRNGWGLDDREDWLKRLADSFRLQEKRFRFEMHDRLETVFETLEVVWPLEVAERIRLITPHLDRGLALLRRAEEQRGIAADLEAVLTRALTAVLVVGPDARLRFANASAEALLRCGDALRVRNGHLVARWPADERALTAAVSSASERPARAPASTAEATSAVVISLRRDQDRPPYRASIVPLRRGSLGAGQVSPDGAVLFVDDPADDAPLAEQAHVSRALRLTPAEARLAILLARGVSLTEAADQFGVTRNTVRAQLRAIFDKTDTHRQAELARLIQGSRSLRISLS